MKFQYIRYAGRGQRRSGCRQRANSSPHRDNGTDLKVALEALRTTLVLLLCAFPSDTKGGRFLARPARPRETGSVVAAE